MSRSLGQAFEHDTIVARATAQGSGALAIVRLSGKNSHAVAQRMFSARRKTSEPAKHAELVLGKIVDPKTGVALDECLAAHWYAPHSFTGEDCVEFHLHGSPVVVGEVISLSLREGARLAEPGEFSQRAYKNGKLDLAQAEAICDLISARTVEASRLALQQLSGGLSKQCDDVRNRMVRAIAELEAYVDFPEEGLGIDVSDRLYQELKSIESALHRWLENAQRGIATRDGVRVLLAGKPNAGKSSLFNALLKRERAIVTPHAGTTRDTLEAEISLQGVPVTLVDTAGLRASLDEVERLGIERTLSEFQLAQLVLFVVDLADTDSATDEMQSCNGVPHLIVLNKADQVRGSALPESIYNLPGCLGTISISVLTGKGLPELEARVLEAVAGKTADSSSAMITNRRHQQAITQSAEYLSRAAEDLRRGISPEFLLVDLTESVAQIDSITGRQGLDEDVLDELFSTFCLGK